MNLEYFLAGEGRGGAGAAPPAAAARAVVGSAAGSARSFDAVKLREGGLTVTDMRKVGVPLSEIRRAFALSELRDVFEAEELLWKGRFTPAELRSVGFSADELRRARVSVADIQAAGYSASEVIRAYSYAVSELREAGFTVKQLASCGIPLHRLRQGGFTDAEIVAGGISLGPAHVCNMSGSAMCKSGCNPEISSWKRTGAWGYRAEYDGGSIGEYGYSYGCQRCGYCPYCKPDGCPS